jgi:RNA polymerase sigma-70 factor (ECF subfamily)
VNTSAPRSSKETDDRRAADTGVPTPVPQPDDAGAGDPGPGDAEPEAGRPDDRPLVERAQAGDRRAFQELVERYQHRVYMVAFGMLRDREDALDITQEAFIRVHRYLPEFKGSASFYTWLYRIVVNLCIDAKRRGGHEAEAAAGSRAGSRTVEDLPAGADAGGRPPVIDDPETGMERKELARALGQALEGLSPNHRAVILLREVDGLSYKEMARVMKCSQGTIMSRLFHARKRMQDALSRWLGTGASKK